MARAHFKAGLAAFALTALLCAPAWAAPLKILGVRHQPDTGPGRCRRARNFRPFCRIGSQAAHIDAVVINAGVSGDTSADGLSRLDWSLADHPDAAIIEMGSNDALRGARALRNGERTSPRCWIS